MSSGSDKTVTQVAQNSYPEWGVNAAKDVINRGTNLANTPWQGYTGQRIAGMAPEQQQGFAMAKNIATGGTAAVNSAEQNYADTMTGKYMSPDSNPWLKQNVNQALNDVQTRVNSQFGGANYGTTAHQETLARSLGDTASKAYGDNYAAERRYQMAGQAMAPTYQNMAYDNAAHLTAIGDAQRNEAQDLLNLQYGDWQSQQNHPYKQLDTLNSALRGAVGGQGSTTTTAPNPYQANKYANAMGGALTGWSLGSKFGDQATGGYGGWGAAAGGLLGLLG